MGSILRDATSADKLTSVSTGEQIEEWIAVKGGGFIRPIFNLPAVLCEADLLRLYDAMLHLDLHDMWKRYEADRVSFLAYLKDDVGLSSLADRQHFANALARCKRLGTFDAAATPSKAEPFVEGKI